MQPAQSIPPSPAAGAGTETQSQSHTTVMFSQSTGLCRPMISPGTPISMFSELHREKRRTFRNPLTLLFNEPEFVAHLLKGESRPTVAIAVADFYSSLAPLQRSPKCHPPPRGERRRGAGGAACNQTAASCMTTCPRRTIALDDEPRGSGHATVCEFSASGKPNGRVDEVLGRDNFTHYEEHFLATKAVNSMSSPSSSPVRIKNLCFFSISRP